jgi:uncharacterized YccA/Bax inhibitor family protein
VRTTSNPAFRNLPTQGGYASFDRQGGAMAGGAAYADVQASQAGIGRAGTGERQLTVDDVVMKSAITIAVAIVAGVATILTQAWVLTLPAFIIGFIVSLVVIFKQSSNPALVLIYSAMMGVALGGITGLLELQGTKFEGIGFQAVVGTIGVFIGMLVVYKTGAVKVTPKFTKWLTGAIFGVVILMVVNLLVSFFTTGGIGLRDGSPLAYLFSIVCIGVAAFSLMLDFDMADKAVKGGAPAKFAWYIAFGLMTTLVWLYLEILRLLSYFRQ